MEHLRSVKSPCMGMVLVFRARLDPEKPLIGSLAQKFSVDRHGQDVSLLVIDQRALAHQPLKDIIFSHGLRKAQLIWVPGTAALEKEWSVSGWLQSPGVAMGKAGCSSASG